MMSMQGYGTAKPRIGLAKPTGAGIIQRQIASTSAKPRAEEPPPMKTAQARLGKR